LAFWCLSYLVGGVGFGGSLNPPWLIQVSAGALTSLGSRHGLFADNLAFALNGFNASNQFPVAGKFRGNFQAFGLGLNS
jgi:hypothetical protein